MNNSKQELNLVKELTLNEKSYIYIYIYIHTYVSISVYLSIYLCVYNTDIFVYIMIVNVNWQLAV